MVSFSLSDIGGAIESTILDIDAISNLDVDMFFAVVSASFSDVDVNVLAVDCAFSAAAHNDELHVDHVLSEGGGATELVFDVSLFIWLDGALGAAFAVAGAGFAAGAGVLGFVNSSRNDFTSDDAVLAVGGGFGDFLAGVIESSS